MFVILRIVSAHHTYAVTTISVRSIPRLSESTGTVDSLSSANLKP